MFPKYFYNKALDILKTKDSLADINSIDDSYIASPYFVEMDGILYQFWGYPKGTEDIVGYWVPLKTIRN